MPIHVHERRVEAELLLRPVEILVRRLRIEAEQVVVVEVAKRGRPDARQHLGHGHLPLGRPPKRVLSIEGHRCRAKRPHVLQVEDGLEGHRQLEAVTTRRQAHRTVHAAHRLRALPVAVNVKLHGVRVIVRPLAVDVEAKEVLRRRHMRVMDVDRWQSQHLAVCVRREESPRIDPDGADGELCGELGRVHPARRVPLVATAGERADALERPRAVGRGRLAELEVDRRWRRAH
mmetsp:Transcript_12012/g.30262  ORF Transcript_12012/g.30262 Transcript_12012/m.30262 type:complete len:232 (+) Transcript_12012:948-1643(+)